MKIDRFCNYLVIIGKDAKDHFIYFHQKKDPNNPLNNYLEYEMENKVTDEQLRFYLLQIWKFEDMKELMEFSLEKKKRYLQMLKDIPKVSILQIARITGVSRTMIEKVLKE